jgi:hypothetical protein
MDRPSRSELIERCPDCGEELDFGREECVTLSCSRYLEITESLERESVYSPLRDVRESRGEDEEFVKGECA